jgi:hypothetical protein
VPQNPTTSKVRVSFLKLEGSLKVTDRSICPSGKARYPGMIPWKGTLLGRSWV